MIKTYLQNRIQKVILPPCSSDCIKLYQGVPQGTIMGPLLFNIYVDFMRSSVQRPTQLVQYADDTFLYSASGNLEQSIKYLETNIKNVTLFFERHRLNINADKTEFMIFCKKSQNHIADHRQFKVKNKFIEQSKSAKNLGVYLDQNLTYQMEIQNILRKLATGIKVLYSFQNILPEKTPFTAEFTSSKPSPLLFYFDKWYFAESSVNLRETIKLGCESLLSQEEIRFIERSQVTIQNFTCGSLFGFESCSLFLEISK